MRVIIVDDEVDFGESLQDMIESEGYEVDFYCSIHSAQEALSSLEEPIVVISDHDFGGIEVGYDFCKWLREKHPFGLLLPIIYLTGRGSDKDYLNQQQESPFNHPNAFISKDQLSSDDDLLPDILSRYSKGFEQIQELFENQSARQALIGFKDMEPIDYELN
ncbi:MAG: hypothetical protein B6244_02605 [Candidatus Cloacimonetes bacterium 4572_55]|nr:MAG: hypothetical protein B6244_02605 [Candidatus Cloacimonetes bacterium 4572_55]